MTPEINKIVKAFARALTNEVTKTITQQLRESYVADVTAIVKECLNNNEILRDSGMGYLTIDDLCRKYHVSRKTVGDKCRLFNIERKKSGRMKLVNEKEFLNALQRPVEKPKFLRNKDAA
ncbi:MAG: hypothetical protein ACXVPU_07315 [Bacteroidia bacterium]